MSVLKAFRDLTGEEAALLFIKDNKVYRLSTLLKDKNGNAMHGVPIADGDPVAKALLAGQDYQGLAIRGGKFNFSTVKLLRGADGKAWGAYSIRIALDGELKRIRDQFGGLVAGKTGYVPTSFGRRTKRPSANLSCIRNSRKRPWWRPISRPTRGQWSVISSPARTGCSAIRCWMPMASEREKLTFAATSAAWGWTVATGSWLDEYLEESHALRNLVVVISIVSALLLAALSYVLVHYRLRGLVQLVGEVSRLSQGDLRVQVQDADPQSRNEVHAIAHAFNLMAEGMRNLVRGVASTSGQVDVAANELQNAARQAMDSAQSAAQSASGIAASVEELSVSITQVADNANQANWHCQRCQIGHRRRTQRGAPDDERTGACG